MCIAAAAIPAISLGVSVASTAAGIFQAQQQAALQAGIAQQQANMQAQIQAANVAMQNQSMNQQSLFQWQNQRLQIQQQRSAQQFQFDQQMNAQRLQQQQTMAQMTQQVNQSREQQRLQAQQQNAALRLQAENAAKNYNLSIVQANAQIANQYQEARERVINERATIVAKNAAERLVYQKRVEYAQYQVKKNNEAANRVYEGEQAKLNEARKKAAFEQQAILAKAIGDKGSILATGRTGQSIGLLVNDVERQAGFALAQQTASLESAEEQAIIGMAAGENQMESANNQAFNQVGFAPENPYLPMFPSEPNFINPVGLGIYNPSKEDK